MMSVRKESTSTKSKHINSENSADALPEGRASDLCKNKRMGKIIFPVCVLAAGCMWGLMGLLVRSLGAVGIASMEICFIRSIVTLISLFLIISKKCLTNQTDGHLVLHRDRRLQRYLF